MGEFTEDHLDKMRHGIKLFNEGKFWECHEELEGPWMECSHEPAKYVFWAIIQVATALYHFENGNLLGARGMLNKAREKFEKCSSLEGPILKKYLSWDSLKKLVAEIPHDPSLEDFSRLADFKFKEIPDDLHGKP
jgi:predicted metal-dependent hydrolase